MSPAALLFHSHFAPSAAIFLHARQVGAESMHANYSRRRNLHKLKTTVPSLAARRADLSFSYCSRTCAQAVQVRCVFVITTPYEGSNGASFVLKISTFTCG